MVDNVQITAGSGTTIRTDDDGTAQYQCVKLVWGADGTFNFTDTASGKAIPVTLYDSSGNEITATSLVAEDTAFTPGSNLNTIGMVTQVAPKQTADADVGDVVPLYGDSQGRLRTVGGTDFHLTAASQTADRVNGIGNVASSATGDYLDKILIYPTSGNPGKVQIWDGDDTSGTGTKVFEFNPDELEGAVTDLKPIEVHLGIYAQETDGTNQGFHITTGANLSVMLVGNFSVAP